MGEEKKGFWGRLVEGLSKTRDNIVSGIDSIFSGFSSIDDDFYEEIEEILVMGDIGINTTTKIIDHLKERVAEEHITDPEPSNTMVMYGTLANASVGKMFIGGVGPGLLMTVVIIVINYLISKKRGYAGSEHISGKQVAEAFKNGIWALLMPVIILGGIYSGLFTPTEAAAIAVFYGIIVSAFVYRNMGMKDFLHVLSASASSTASILFLVANAHIFSYLLSSEQIPQKLAILMTSLTTNPTIIMFLIMIVLLIAGCFLDNAVAVILLTPIFVNVVQAMNIDICYFGVFLVFVLAIGQVTPPVGLCLFVACDIGKVSIEKVSREVLPYVGGLIVTAILLVLFPQIVTWLPSLTKMA